VIDEKPGGYRLTSENAGQTGVDEHDLKSVEGPGQSDSLSNIRHKLRTPLNHIIGYSEMLLEEAGEQQLVSFVADLNKIHTAGKQLLLMINDFLDPAGPQTAPAQSAPITADSVTLFRDTEARKRPLVSDNHSTNQRPASRLLVVDDNEGNCDMLSRRLSREGYTVETAENGHKALEVIKTQPIDLVLLDVMMPEMNGYEVLERLKADRAWRNIPVIMISALDEIESVVRCIEMGAEDYLPKPFNPVLLKARVTASLEKKRLRDIERLYAQSMEKELAIGRKIQSSFFPDLLPQLPGWEIATYFQAANQVAGDFYDAFFLSDRKAVGLVIADVCDKGVGSALFMALIRSLIRVFSGQTHLCDTYILDNQDKVEGIIPPRELNIVDPTNALIAVALTNDYIEQNHSLMSMFATLFFGVLDPETGVLSYINAGHEPLIIVGPSGIKEELRPTGPAVGIMLDAKFKIEQVQLEPGDILIGFTDGVTEALSPSGEFFTKKRLRPILQQPASSAPELLERIKSSLFAYTDNASQSDDITLLAVQGIPENMDT
jgi:sigma-B regulation protein RsbU (phosphoserine phosphatase)